VAGSAQNIAPQVEKLKLFPFYEISSKEPKISAKGTIILKCLSKIVVRRQ
jgi:hypothetical protein